MAASTVAIWNTVETLPSQRRRGMHGAARHVDDEDADAQHEVTAHHDGGDPERDDLEPGQRDEGRGEQQLVGDGIEEGAEPRLRSPAPRDVAVEQVGEARQAEHEQGRRRACR